MNKVWGLLQLLAVFVVWLPLALMMSRYSTSRRTRLVEQWLADTGFEVEADSLNVGMNEATLIARTPEGKRLHCTLKLGFMRFVLSNARVSAVIELSH
jgi:hypothetical protein